MEYMEISENRTMKSGYRTLDQVQFNRVCIGYLKKSFFLKILPLYVGELPPSMPDYDNGSVVPTQAPTPIPTKSNDCPSIMSDGILSCLTILLVQQIFTTFI